MCNLIIVHPVVFYVDLYCTLHLSSKEIEQSDLFKTYRKYSRFNRNPDFSRRNKIKLFFCSGQLFINSKYQDGFCQLLLYLLIIHNNSSKSVVWLRLRLDLSEHHKRLRPWHLEASNSKEKQKNSLIQFHNLNLKNKVA